MFFNVFQHVLLQRASSEVGEAPFGGVVDLQDQITTCFEDGEHLLRHLWYSCTPRGKILGLSEVEHSEGSYLDHLKVFVAKKHIRSSSMPSIKGPSTINSDKSGPNRGRRPSWQ